MSGNTVDISYEEPNSNEFVKEEEKFIECSEIEPKISEKHHAEEIETLSVNKKNPLSGFFVYFQVENEDQVKLLKNIRLRGEIIPTSNNNSVDQLAVAAGDKRERDIRVKVKIESSPTQEVIELDSQEPDSTRENTQLTPESNATPTVGEENTNGVTCLSPSSQLRRNESDLQQNKQAQDQPIAKIHSHQTVSQDGSSVSSSKGNTIPVPSSGGKDLGTSSKRKKQNHNTVKPPSRKPSNIRDRGVRNDKAQQEQIERIMRLALQPYVRLERMEDIFIESHLRRSGTPIVEVSACVTKSIPSDSSEKEGKKEENVAVAANSFTFKGFKRKKGKSEIIGKRNKRGYLKTYGGKLRCEVCEKEFKHSSVLTNHLRTHTGEKPYPCKVCGRCFAQVGNLTKHFMSHTGEAPYECDICKRRFPQRHHVLRHMRVHTRETPFKCDICGNSFAAKSTLQTHIRVHTRETPYQCYICKRSFSHTGTLTVHIRTHTGETPFHCKYCPRKFKHVSSLNIHTRTHTGETPYQCSVCNKKFVHKSNLINHTRTHTGEKPYKCDVCPKAFSRHHILIDHLWNTHW